MSETVSQPAVPSNRLLSLDVFRGLTIAGMMFVNNPGSWSYIYEPFDHAEWHGWTYTDTIFPFFLWIVGVAIPLSLVRRVESGENQGALFLKIFRRALIIFGVGMFLNAFPFYNFTEHKPLDWGAVRIPGVLQRIAVCYLVTAVIVMKTKVRGQIVAILTCLIGYWVLMATGSVPGFPPGDLTKEGNFSHYIDSLVLGKHAWKSSYPWDPEGTVSTLSAIATCLFGVMAGHLLRSKLGREEKIIWMFVTGAGLMFLGQIMNLWLPINKSLWTSSYSVFMAGLAFTVLAACYWVVDVKRWQKWAQPFAIYGMNAITVFFLAGVLGRLSITLQVTGAGGKNVALKTYLFDTFFKPLTTSPYLSSHLWALVYVLGLYLIAWGMYRKKWFVRF